MIKRVAVIGAGMAGLACARILRRAGCYVEVFEQDRFIGLVEHLPLLSVAEVAALNFIVPAERLGPDAPAGIF